MNNIISFETFTRFKKNKEIEKLDNEFEYDDDYQSPEDPSKLLKSILEKHMKQ